MLYTKIQPQSFFFLGKTTFKRFYHMDMAVILFSGRNHSSNCQYFQQKTYVKSILYMYIAQGQEQVTPREQTIDHS